MKSKSGHLIGSILKSNKRAKILERCKICSAIFSCNCKQKYITYPTLSQPSFRKTKKSVVSKQRLRNLWLIASSPNRHSLSASGPTLSIFFFLVLVKRKLGRKPRQLTTKTSWNQAFRITKSDDSILTKIPQERLSYSDSIGGIWWLTSARLQRWLQFHVLQQNNRTSFKCLENVV